MKRKGSMIILAGCALLLASGSLAAQVRSGSGIRVSKETGTTTSLSPSTTPSSENLAPVSPSPSTTSVAGTVTLSNALMANEETLLRGFTDANIVAHIVTGDSLEVEMARLAETRATSQAVRDFARTLITEHSANRQATIALANDEDTGNQPNPSDTSAAHLMRGITELQNMQSGEAWDRTFMMHQLMHHHHDLQALRVLKDVARDDDLEQQIDEITPVIQRHMDTARTVAQGLGMTVHGN